MVGWIGLALPFTLMLGNYLLFDGVFVLPTISEYYYSPMRDVFVGALVAIALFMSFYSGVGKWDRIVGILAGIFALGVAFFPTPPAGNTDFTGKLHGVFAISLFMLLAAISIFRFPLKRQHQSRKITDRIQVVCGLIMLGCVIAVAGYYYARGFTKSDGCFVFIAESIALMAFGLSWYTEGLDLKDELR
jgi:hypothetical protein